jgi:transposase
MDQLKCSDRRKIIGTFYSKNRSLGKSYTVNHFLKMNIARQTIYDIIKRVDSDISLVQKSCAGRRPVKMPKNKIRQLLTKVDGHKGVSQLKLSKKYGVSQQYVSYLLKKNNVKYYKRKAKPVFIRAIKIN